MSQEKDSLIISNDLCNNTELNLPFKNFDKILENNLNDYYSNANISFYDLIDSVNEYSKGKKFSTEILENACQIFLK